MSRNGFIMLYNSYTFLLFLCATLLLFYWVNSWMAATLVLISASLFFYACFNLSFLLFLIPAILINYVFGKLLIHYKHQLAAKKCLLFLAIVGNLSCLIYFKYSNFILQNLNALGVVETPLLSIVIPIGISFFVFQKIAFLVDTYQGTITFIDLKKFIVFATFFPTLIAGPLFHYREFSPQWERRHHQLDLTQIALGLSLFVIGLFKKVVLADNAAYFADQVFNAAATGQVQSVQEAWIGALAYSFQLYFDFSGYSEMATGIARMFGITLPINFNAPYLAPNIITFWRRWHITLSRFFKDYIYIPLGGNLGKWQRWINLLLVMSLCGLWHGANWTFVLWGLLHGVLLIVNHGWQRLKPMFKPIPVNSHLTYGTSVIITFLCVVTLWVLFRADNLTTALSLLKSMYGWGGNAMVSKDFNHFYTLMLLCFMVTFFLPSVTTLFQKQRIYLDSLPDPLSSTRRLQWSLSGQWAFAIALLFVISFLMLSKTTSFIYFNF